MPTSRDILILSNGPGELTTWVRPTVKALRQQLGEDREAVRISLILSPCPNATGKEEAIARSYSEIDRVQSAKHFFPFLLWGKTAENWDWREQGVILFLGGDQLFPVIVGKRLGYKIAIYAEWEARWWRWADSFGVMNAQTQQQVPEPYRQKVTVVGDLMAEAGRGGDGGLGDGETGRWGDEAIEQGFTIRNPRFTNETVGLLPGSKDMKLRVGVPLTCAIAEHLNKKRPQTRFILPVAPTIDLPTLARYANPQENPVVANAGNISAELITPKDDIPYLKTAGGTRIDLITEFPAYDALKNCQLCVTTVGANTAELAALAVPMLVLLPTQQLDTMKAWDGIIGILVNLPGVGSAIARVVNGIAVRQTQKHKRLYAWPNIWGKREIVPELLGRLEAEEVAALARGYLEHPERLQVMSNALQEVRGEAGAARKLAEITQKLLG
ncbi:lipid-A-disaccharide synthase [Oscillatoria sp. FACHB-1406]|uniref:lipid-A-disaccharide synthase n=1 Tax=Oscillatoria sp. FACHB-1406 TaxID=2692846 RepID=UPI001689A7B4|nr:lipid-A-disaccharide synthase [Oscillatoria sp. FACHB-1406]MBD2578763.1 lipid-A-disaccharide synthase [Oscillatoria sp. FACHB-1406]